MTAYVSDISLLWEMLRVFRFIIYPSWYALAALVVGVIVLAVRYGAGSRR